LRVDDDRAFPVPWQYLIDAKTDTLLHRDREQIPDRRFAASGMTRRGNPRDFSRQIGSTVDKAGAHPDMTMLKDSFGAPR
jgi:hypothetical protein